MTNLDTLEPEFMADALDDLRDDTLAHAPVRYLPGTHVVDDPVFCMTAMMQMQANLFAAEQQRRALANLPYVAAENSARATRAASYREGLRPAPKRETAEQRNAREVEQMYGSRPLLRGEK